MQTHIYKQVGTLDIKADVYLPAGQGRAPHPVIVYIHGGSLIGGGRDKVAKFALRDELLAKGVAVVSIDYRLAPETKLAGIAEDVEDAFRWVREKGPALFGADPKRVGAAGGSAGGYLTLLAGFRVQPKLRVLLVESGYGDIIGPWQTNPSRHPPHYETRPTREEAWKEVSGPPIADGRDRPSKSERFNNYVRQRGLWPEAISGWNPLTQTEKFIPYVPVRNVTKDYPPTFLIHGRNDTDIPFEIAEMMDAELGKHGVEHRLIGIAGGEHGYAGADPRLVDEAHREAAIFILPRLVGTR